VFGTKVDLTKKNLMDAETGGGENIEFLVEGSGWTLSLEGRNKYLRAKKSRLKAGNPPGRRVPSRGVKGRRTEEEADGRTDQRGGRGQPASPLKENDGKEGNQEK